MGNRHIGNAFRGTQYQPDHIRIGIFVVEHLVYNKSSGCKITGYMKIFRFAQHDSGHQIIDVAAKITESRMVL